MKQRRVGVPAAQEQQRVGVPATNETALVLTHSELQKATRMRYAKLHSMGGQGKARRARGSSAEFGLDRSRLRRAITFASSLGWLLEIEVMTWLGTRSYPYRLRRRARVS